jgi:hypothetical protein
LLKPKKAARRFGGAFGDFIDGDAAQFRDVFGDEAGVGGFAAFTAMGHGGEIGAIGLDHKLIGGNGASGDLDIGRILERDDASEGDEMAESDDLRGLFRSATEAMENAADAAGVILEDFERVVP